jgi:hypothetical protein
MQNPLLKSNNTINIDDNTIEITYLNSIKYFKYAYVLTKINDYVIPDEFFGSLIDEKLYEEVAKNLMLKKVSINILKNKMHYNSMAILSSSVLEKYNIFKYKLDDNNMVITLLSSNYIKLETYLNQYNTTNFLESIYNHIVFNNFFKIIKFNIHSFINNIAETNFWNNDDNLITLNDAFQVRTFKFDRLTITDMKLNDALDNAEKEDYLKSNNITFTSMTDMLNGRKKNRFVIRDSKIFSKDDIVRIFNALSPNDRFLLFANMLITRDYAHLVLNNQQILIMMMPSIHKYYNLFKYLIGYAWITFYLNESIKKSHVKTNDEFIFDINTAHELPTYNYSHIFNNYNPYSTLLCSNTVLMPENNICGIPDYKDKKNYGIINFNNFKVNMNLFTTGNINNDLFVNIDFGNNIAITGSIMTACLQLYHPLLDNFTGDINQKTVKFYDEYYSKSDIDIMVKTSDTFEYIEIVNRIYKQIVINIIKLNPANAKPEHTKLILNKKANFFVSEQFIKDLKFNSYGISDIKEAIEYVRKNANTNKEIRDQLYALYAEKIISPLLNDETKTKYTEFFDDNIEFAITVNKTNHDMTLIVNYKYNIKSPHLLHNLELFQVRYDDFFATVAKFHLPCVRAYYNGSNVYMTPSCITAHMTYMNIDYKYFSGTQDPIEIINKYRMRGFGTWLSEKERKQYIAYSKNVTFWSDMLNINNNDSCAHGAIDINNMFFKPRLYHDDYYINSNPVDLESRYEEKEQKYMNINHINTYTGLISIQNVSAYSPIELLTPIFNQQTIGFNGNVNKVNKWMIDAVYNSNNFL